MFYDRFTDLCKSHGKSPAAVAREIGLSNSSTTTWKQGSTPKGDTLRKLANYFGVSVDYLLNGGSKINPIFPSRRIFSAINEKKISLEKMSQLTGISVETIRSFALGEKVENGHYCLDELAKRLDVEPAFLINYPTDDAGYWGIDEDIWKTCNNDSDSVHGAQQVLELDSIDHERAPVSGLLGQCKRKELTWLWDMALDQKLAHIGYSIEFAEGHEEYFQWINYPDGTLEVTDAELMDLNQSTDSFLRFKLQELKDRHSDRFRPKREHRDQTPHRPTVPPESTPAPPEGKDTTPPPDAPETTPEGK